MTKLRIEDMKREAEETLIRQAKEHYEEISSQAGCYNPIIPQALDALLATDPRLLKAIEEMKAILYYDDNKTLEYRHGVEKSVDILYDHIPIDIEGIAEELLQLRKEKALLIADGERLAEWLEYAPLDYSNGVTYNGIDEGRVKGRKGHEELLKQHKELMESLEEEV